MADQQYLVAPLQSAGAAGTLALKELLQTVAAGGPARLASLTGTPDAPIRAVMAMPAALAAALAAKYAGRLIIEPDTGLLIA